MKAPAPRPDVTVAWVRMPLVRLGVTTSRFSSVPEGNGMPRIRKIVFLHEHQFSEAYYRSFGIQALESRGFDVEVWNIAPFVQKPDYLRAYPPCPFACKNHVAFQTRLEAVRAIQALSPDCFIVVGIHLNAKTLGLYRALAKRNLICASFLAMAFPVNMMPKARSIPARLRNLTWSNIAEKLISHMPYALLGIKPVDIVFATAGKFLTYGYPHDDTSERLWVHNLDYDHFLTERIEPCDVNPKRGIFLDEYFPYHPDNALINAPDVPAEPYFERLRAFFDHLESRHGVEIVIAAHPRADYTDKPGVFGERPIIQHRTSRLVRESGFVILHQSMSLNHAVLYAKPMIFVATDAVMDFLFEAPRPQWLADIFRKPLHNLDRGLDIDFEVEMRLDEEGYRTYINDYIKRIGSPERPFWEIVADRISMIG